MSELPSHELTESVREALARQLRQRDLEVVDVVPIPVKADPMVRLRTLEEALNDFDSSDSAHSIGYLIQLKPKVMSAPNVGSGLTPKASPDNVYLHDGKLNIPYLSKNAELLFAAGEYGLARNIFKSILQSGERTAASHYWIGRCLEAEGKLDEAREKYSESIAYQPALDTFRHLAALWMRQKKDAYAADVLERALNLRELPQTTRFELHLACGNCWTRAHKHQDGEAHFRKALELNPTADEVRSNLGALYLDAGRITEALRCFQDATTTNQRNGKAWTGLGTCHLTAGDKRAAHDCFARSLDIDLNNPTAVFHLVKCAYELKTYATATRIVEEYLQVAPVNANLVYSLAGLQYHLGRTRDAAATARKTLELSPQHSGASELLNLIERTAGA